MKIQTLTIAIFVCLSCRLSSLVAADIRLRKDCTPAAAIITLGDIASVLATGQETPSEVARLTGLELLTTPASQPRFLSYRQVQDLLVERGVNLTAQNMSGSSRVTIRPRTARQDNAAAKFLDARSLRNTKDHTTAAVVAYLHQQVDDQQAWQVELDLDRQTAQAVASGEGQLRVSGGTAPWVGAQTFMLTVHSAAGETVVSVAAQVALPASVVVAVRPIQRGQIVRAGDLQLQRSDAFEQRTANGFSSIEAVVGLEAKRPIAAGRPLDSRSLQRPILVRRGDVITVSVYSAGIRVQTEAVAREEGSLNDPIEVNALQDRRNTYTVRVTGPGAGHIYARPIVAGPKATVVRQ